MARRERVEPERAEEGFRLASLNRAFVMASEAVFAKYHRERREIDDRYPLLLAEFTDDERAAMVSARAFAREELRADVRRSVVEYGFSGPYLIPV